MADSPKSRRVLRIPARRGFWLFSYEQAKYDTPFHWFATVLLAGAALAVGVPLCWYFISHRADATTISFLLRLIVSMGVISYGLLNFPSGLVYFFRRWRGISSGPFDYEVIEDGNRKGDSEKQDDATDHR